MWAKKDNCVEAAFYEAQQSKRCKKLVVVIVLTPQRKSCLHKDELHIVDSNLEFEKEKHDFGSQKPKKEEFNFFEENVEDEFEDSSCDSVAKLKPNPWVCFLIFHFVN